MVRQLKARRVAVIFVSHRLNEIFGLADSYLVLRDGRQVKRGLIAQTSSDELVRNMVGRAIAAAPHAAGSAGAAEEVLRVEGLSREGVLENISFSVRGGEVVGIAVLIDEPSPGAARFDPPVAPDVNTCAAPAIYRQRFGHGGAVAIPVDFTE